LLLLIASPGTCRSRTSAAGHKRTVPTDRFAASHASGGEDHANGLRGARG